MTDPRLRQRRIEVARANGRRRLRIVLGLFVLAGAVTGALFMLHSPLLAARAISVKGAPGVPRSEVIATSGLGPGTPLIDVDTAAVEAKLESIPLVDTASVAKHWPDGISIVLTERSPRAQVEPTSPGSSWAVVDSHGRLLYRSQTEVAGLPVLDAGSFAHRVGSYLGVAARPLLLVAAAIPAALAPAIAAIGLDQSGQIVLQLPGRRVALLGDTEALAEKLVSLATVLHDVPMRDVAVVDLTAPGSPVLTPIGARPTLNLVAGG